MSNCTECDSEMHPAEASMYEICYDCRREKGKDGKVRTLSRSGSDQIGRKVRDSRALSSDTREMSGG